MMSSLPQIKSEDGGGQNKQPPQIAFFGGDNKNDDSSSVSSVNAVNGVEYLEGEEHMIGGEDVSTQGNSDGATHAKKHKYHPTKNSDDATADTVFDQANNRGEQRAVKLEDDVDGTPADMKDHTVAAEQHVIAFQQQLEKGDPYKELAVVTGTTIVDVAGDHSNDHQPLNEVEPEGNANLNQRETAAAAIPMYSFSATEEDDSGNEDSKTNSNINEEGTSPRARPPRRPITSWMFFQMTMKGKGLTREQIVRILMRCGAR
jgi:hypothetical protein